MARYTMRLGTYLHNLRVGDINREQYQTFDEIEKDIELSREKLFDFEYPIFDSKYKQTLETKILRTYYMDEIGLETPGLFKHYLMINMCNLMPYYNQLYESAKLQFEPLLNMDYKIEHEGDDVGSYDRLKGGNINTTTNETIDTDTDRWNDGNTVTNETSETNVAKTGKDTFNKLGNEKNTKTQSGSVEVKDVYPTIKTIHGQGENEGWKGNSKTPQTGLSDVRDLRYLTTADAYYDKVGQVDETTDPHTDIHTTTYNDKQDVDVLEFVNRKDVTEYNNNLHTDVDSETDDQYTDHTYENVETEKNGFVDTDTSETEGGSDMKHSEYFDKYKGISGITYSKALQEYRETFLNIDMMVIDSLSGLFMNIY